MGIEGRAWETAECPIQFLQCIRTGWTTGFGGNKEYPILHHDTQGWDRYWGFVYGYRSSHLAP